MANISVVVPVYKVEPYLRRCVDSILGQTYTDFELILVDDGSPDNCGEICDEYAKKDARVHVLHLTNSGAAAARNTALDWIFTNSDSQWLAFIDGDDWVHPNYLHRLLTGALECGADVCVCDYCLTSGEKEPEILTNRVVRFRMKDLWAEKRLACTVVWGKLVKRELFSNIRFPLRRAEDEFAVYQALFQTDKAGWLADRLYAYRMNSDSLTHQKWSRKDMDSIDAFAGQMAFFDQNGYRRAFRTSAWAYLSAISRNLRDGWNLLSPEERDSLMLLCKREIRRYGLRCFYQTPGYVKMGAAYRCLSWIANHLIKPIYTAILYLGIKCSRAVCTAAGCYSYPL